MPYYLDLIREQVPITDENGKIRWFRSPQEARAAAGEYMNDPKRRTGPCEVRRFEYAPLD